MGIFTELQRRNVFKVAVSYLVLAWVVVQVTAIAVPALHLPIWVNSLVFYFGCIGFPFALFFAWAFELTPEGIKKTRDVEDHESIAKITGRKIDFIIIAMLMVALALLLVDRESTKERLNAQSEPHSSTFSAGPSIAVLPFVNMSSDSEQEYFSDGISEELLNLLAKIPEMKVAGRTSSFAFKGLKQDLREIGNKLGVDHLLEGSVRKQGIKVRITAQLIRASDGIHLWSETYDRNLNDIFAVQDEIADKITRQLKVSLLGEEPLNIQVKDVEVSAKAHNYYLLGLQRYNQAEYKPLLEARNYFEQAYTESPKYLDAYFYYALANKTLENYGTIDIEEAISNIKNTLEKLNLLGVQRSSRFIAFSGVLELYKKNIDVAKAKFTQAYEKSPNDPMVIMLYRLYAKYTGNADKSIMLLKRLLVIDPLNMQILQDMAAVYLYTQQPDKALPLLDKIQEIDPSYAGSYLLQGDAYFLAGKLDESVKSHILSFKHDPNDPEAPALIAITLIQLGLYQQAEYYLQQADSLAINKPMTIATRIYMLHVQGADKEAGEAAIAFLLSKPNHRSFSRNVSLRVAEDYLVKTEQYQRYTDLLFTLHPALKSRAFSQNMVEHIDTGSIYWSVLLAKAYFYQGAFEEAQSLSKEVLAFGKEHLSRFPSHTHRFFWQKIIIKLSLISKEYEQAVALLKDNEKWMSLNVYVSIGQGVEGYKHLKGQPAFDQIIGGILVDLKQQQKNLIEYFNATDKL